MRTQVVSCSTMALAVVALNLISSDTLVAIYRSREISQVRVVPPRDREKFGQRAQEALDGGKYAEALELAIQAIHVDPSVENVVLRAQALVGLGRLAEAYGHFERVIKKDDSQSFDVAVWIAYGDAARGTNHLTHATHLYAYALDQIAAEHQSSSSKGKIRAVSPRKPRGPSAVVASSLAIELYYPHTVPGSTKVPEKTVDRLAKMREIDRLTPSWERVWPLLLWNVDTSNAQMKAFALTKLTRLGNSSDQEVRKVAQYILRREGLVKE